MCGLVGWRYTGGQAPTTDVLARMASSIAHRGPDDHGYFEDVAAGIAIGHRRLSIIDIGPDSHQPMVDAASGVVLAYNGEIYNFRELRAELVARGYAFRSAGDTEVLLRAYLEWGINCLARLAGMFAFAIWDPRTRDLHLARDAMGMKPLYYTARPGGIVFASEVKAFLALPGFFATPDTVGLQQYLEFGYVFDLQRTMLQGVQKLGPGERILVRESGSVVRSAWFAPPMLDPADHLADVDRLEELRATLSLVVEQHLVADVPVGLLLSGGLDSSVIAALAARSGPLNTIAMGFAGSQVDERAQARDVATHIGSTHIEVLIQPDEVRREIEAGAWVFDDLFGDWGTVSTRLLYRRCREMGIKVVLVGEGADELFGGYDVFRHASSPSLWNRFRLYQRYAGRRHGKLFGAFDAVMRDYLKQTDGDAFAAVRLFESRRQLPNNYVMKVDKASMAESVEARAPYLDRRIAEIAYRTPRALLQRDGENKHLLRTLARHDELLEGSAAGRKKFGAPLAASWMDDDPGFRAFARERILGADSLSQRLGFGPAMRAYFDAGRRGYGWPRALSVFSDLAWRLLLLELWASHYLQRHGQARASIPVPVL